MTEEPFVNRLIKASAGSGKTHQLTNRYLALLVAGVESDTILATTFTRKAAGEILDRVLKRLAEAASDDGEAKRLAEQIEADKGAKEDFVLLLRHLLCNLHRVRIGTLDSFYISLAGCFSLELGLPPGWSITEEADDKALQRDAVERLLDQQPEDIERLLPLLSKGETTRSVHGELLDVISKHHECFRGSERSAWECLHLPKQVSALERTVAVEQLRGLDFSACRDKRFIDARDKDVANFERGDWQAFVGSGLASKVVAGESTYQRKQIPPQAQTLYRTLLQHAQSNILQKLAGQTKATWELLDRFHGQLWTLKRATGALRFGEVTQALVDALPRKVLIDQAMDFRLDGAIEHLLLDEFQDTSLAQWRVLYPIAQAITRARAESPRSFFCVGDVKQAIYGWRGGMTEILNSLPNSLGQLQQEPLDQSRRSAQPIIDVINQVFGGLDKFQPGEKNQDGVTAWHNRFTRHTTVKKEITGFVCLHSGPAQLDGQKIDKQREAHCTFVAEKIRDLVQQSPCRSIGVLCRKNDTVARMIYELRERRVEASEEGGNPLTDSPAVDIVLSLFTLADHPGHSVAWFHLKNSPLVEHLDSFTEATTLAQHLRRQILTSGYGPFTHDWAKRLAPACNRRDLSRLQQLVEIAYAYQPRSTLRPDDFVAWIQGQRVPDPSGARVKVMTIHAAKGLEFDAVVLPELDAGLTGQTPAFVVGRDPISLDVNFVCRYADETVQNLLTEEERKVFAEDRQHRVEESLSLLYVALTRAKHAIYLFIPGPRDGRSTRKDAWYALLKTTLAPDTPMTECASLFEHGDAKWFQQRPAETTHVSSPTPERPEQITFRTAEPIRRRGLELVAPSSREGRGRVMLARLFHPSEGTGLVAGTIYHAWFESIAWLDDGVPTNDKLRAIAEKAALDVPPKDRPDLDKLLAEFSRWLENPAIRGVLKEAAYANPHQPFFPAALEHFWTNMSGPITAKVERERRIFVRDRTKFWNGTLDRIVWLSDGDRLLAADVLDFKTDDIQRGNEAALKERTEHYRPQMEAYRTAVAALSQLDEKHVSVRLIFTKAGCVVPV